LDQTTDANAIKHTLVLYVILSSLELVATFFYALAAMHLFFESSRTHLGGFHFQIEIAIKKLEKKNSIGPPFFQ
jgi:hypothetical protein